MLKVRSFYSTDRQVVLQETTALEALTELPAASVDLVLMDPPWNTGETQQQGVLSYPDAYSDFRAMLLPVLQQCRRVLRGTGICAVHMGIKEAHHVRCWLDEVFGEENFQAELIAHHEAGRGAGTCWAQKHSHIFIYSVSALFCFNADAVPWTERKAPVRTYVGDKRVNSVLPATLSTSDGQRVGYPSQKPLALYQAIVEVHTNPGWVVCDPFCGSGTTGDAAQRCGRFALLADRNPMAVDVVVRRLSLHAEK